MEDTDSDHDQHIHLDGQLTEAVRMWQIELVRMYLHQGAIVDARDISGVTALQFACRNGLDDVAELLIEHGADVQPRTIRAKQHCTSLLGQTIWRNYFCESC